MAELTRRDFTKTLAAAAAMGAYVSPGAGADSWFDEPLRWGQLTLVAAQILEQVHRAGLPVAEVP